MKEIILVKYGEIALKGLNKSTFEDMLQKNIKRRLKKLGTFGFYRRQSTIYITPPEEADIDEVINRLQKDIRHQRDTACAAPYSRRISALSRSMLPSTCAKPSRAQRPSRWNPSAATRRSR